MTAPRRAPETRRIHRTMKPLLLTTMLAAAGMVLAAPAAAYDPLAVATDIAPPRELSVTDSERNRVIPLLVSLPTAPDPAPVILFSHGLGGSRNASSYLREHWAAHGYVAVFLQHPGSDESVWRDVPRRQRLQAMKQAASIKNMQARVGDVAAVLDALATWHQTPDHPLAGRLDLEHVGMSGHSFGARTTQAVAGQSGWPARDGPDSRIDAAVIFSPSSPPLRSAAAAFGEVAIPWLLMTGTEDVAAIGGETVESRLTVFPALPPGDKYELVLAGGKHSAFTGRDSLQTAVRNPNHHRAIKAISTAFWDAFLKGDEQAEAWLDGNGPRSVLEQADRWQTK